MCVKTIKKEVMNLKENKGKKDTWEGLEGGKEGRKCCNYMVLLKKFKKELVIKEGVPV